VDEATIETIARPQVGQRLPAYRGCRDVKELVVKEQWTSALYRRQARIPGELSAVKCAVVALPARGDYLLAA
jgi:hypothetical protein